jgi:hypothetical protein
VEEPLADRLYDLVDLALDLRQFAFRRRAGCTGLPRQAGVLPLLLRHELSDEIGVQEAVLEATEHAVL